MGKFKMEKKRASVLGGNPCSELRLQLKFCLKHPPRPPPSLSSLSLSLLYLERES